MIVKFIKKLYLCGPTYKSNTVVSWGGKLRYVGVPLMDIAGFSQWIMVFVVASL